MKETIIKASEQEILGTGLSGYLRATTNAIVKAFGDPNHGGSIDNKIRFDWHLKLVMEDGDEIIFTIYDWKDKTSFKRIRDWHVGSRRRFRTDSFSALKSLFEGNVRNAKFVASDRA